VAFLDDPAIAADFINFALLQLAYLVSLSQSKEADRSNVPEWLCRDPSNWLSQVARRTPHLLKRAQADRAVEYAATLLEVSASDASSVSFTDGCVVAD